MTETSPKAPALRRRGRAVAALGAVFLLLAACGSPNPVPAPTTGPGSPAPSAPSSPTNTPLPSTASPSAAAVPVVPVVAFRSGLTSVGRRDLIAALGGGGRWGSLELVAADADAILAALGVERPTDAGRLVLAPDHGALAADLRAHPDRLAFLRASDVGPSVRALAWEGRDLFGVDRVRSLADWPLNAGLAARAGQPAFDPSAVWTMWAGGDLGLDRSVAYAVKDLGKGVDYPYDGGTARIAGTSCCSSFGWPVPRIVRTGNAGAMRHLISAADLAVANLEEPAPDAWTYHAHGTVFTGDPALLAGIARAGIDVVSTATNHIGDGGRVGILQTLAHLDAVGIRHAGSGANLVAARRPALVTVGGVRVAFLAYDAIPPASYFATATTTGSAPLVASYVRSDIAAAHRAGADVIVVYPHWGTEYTRGPTSFQRSMAHLMIDAGADLVIGNHPHWVQAVEVYKGRPIWYALGNLTFDQAWSEPTMEGISLELTFDGSRLVQVRMLPHVLVGAVQPNLLDPAGDGRRVLDPVFEASSKLLPW